MYVLLDISNQPLPIQFFYGIWQFFVSIFNLIKAFLLGFCDLIDYLTEGRVTLSAYIDWLPASFVAIVVGIFGIVVVYKILGREG